MRKILQNLIDNCYHEVTHAHTNKINIIYKNVVHQKKYYYKSSEGIDEWSHFTNDVVRC